MFFRFLPSILVYQLMWALFSCKKKLIIPYGKGVFEAAKTLSLFMEERKVILSRQDNIPEREFVKLIDAAEKEAVHSIMTRRTAEGKTNFLLLCYSKLFL